MKEPKKLTKPLEGSYNAQEYIDNYVNNGQFPKIYDDFGRMVRLYANESEPCIDLGACTGLMAIYNVHNGRSACIGIEGNKHDYERRIEHPDVSYLNFYIGPATLDLLRNLLATGGATLITARRVFPEIGIKDVAHVNMLAPLFHEYGVNKIILEGRVDSSKATSELHNADLEAACFYPYYKVTKRWNRVLMLERDSMGNGF